MGKGGKAPISVWERERAVDYGGGGTREWILFQAGKRLGERAKFCRPRGVLMDGWMDGGFCTTLTLAPCFLFPFFFF